MYRSSHIYILLILILIFISCKNEVQKSPLISVEESESTTTLSDENIETTVSNDAILEEVNEVPISPKPKSNTIGEPVNDESKIVGKADAIRIVKEEITEKIKAVKQVSQEETTSNSDSNSKNIDHTLFSELLSKYVLSNGKVNYKAFKKEEGKLDSYIEQLSKVKNINSLKYKEKLCFWINIYNAYTIKMILKNYPIKSIKDLYGGEPWSHRWVNVNTTQYTLNEIENDIIRKNFGEPLIHFALNCGAKSCPPISNKAFIPQNLNFLLSQNTRSFINSNENTISKSNIQLSKIFDWYKEDFGNVVEFISKYSNVKPLPNAVISYKNYDWSLNE